MMKNLALLLALWAAAAGTLQGQVLPPDLLCVANDSLQWEVPENNCGPFNSYLVYASQQEEGPYTLLAEITDPTQTVYFHEDAPAGVWYYYLESDFDCPGEVVLQSDTLDSLNPEQVELLSASVEGSDVRLTWAPSASPEVIGYIISRNIPGTGTVAIDTVLGQTDYLDTGASADSIPERYFVEAIDACGNKSIISESHRTILLELENADSCNRSISLSWLAYEGWTYSGYRIELSRDGSPFQPVSEVAASMESFELTDNIINGLEYCFRVVAIRADGPEEALSNTFCVTPNVVGRIEEADLINATVTENGIELSYRWNEEAPVSAVQILRGAGNDLTPIGIGVAGLPSGSSYLDTTVNLNGGPYTYQVELADPCADLLASNTVQTIFLEASSFIGLNDLRWTPYQSSIGTVESYQLFREDDGADVSLGIFDANTLLSEDRLDLSDPNQVQACYYVEAQVTVNLPDGSRRSVVSRSNRACAQQEIRVYIPSAFSPNGDGRNDVFRPYLQFGRPLNYEMTIYDRWGGQIFQTTDFDTGWEGQDSNGERVPVGPYAFVIRIEQEDGNIIQESGEVALLR